MRRFAKRFSASFSIIAILVQSVCLAVPLSDGLSATGLGFRKTLIKVLRKKRHNEENIECWDVRNRFYGTNAFERVQSSRAFFRLAVSNRAEMLLWTQRRELEEVSIDLGI